MAAEAGYGRSVTEMSSLNDQVAGWVGTPFYVCVFGNKWLTMIINILDIVLIKFIIIQESPKAMWYYIITIIC